MPGPQVVRQLRARRTGALFNEHFARYLEALGPSPRASLTEPGNLGMTW